MDDQELSEYTLMLLCRIETRKVLEEWFYGY